MVIFDFFQYTADYTKIMLYAPGESGSYLYVAAEGEYDVIKDGKVLGRWIDH